jgi:hypothetical protein
LNEKVLNSSPKETSPLGSRGSDSKQNTSPKTNVKGLMNELYKLDVENANKTSELQQTLANMEKMNTKLMVDREISQG